MGLCGSSGTAVDKDELERSKAIQNEMALQDAAEKRIKKLLLLGAGESGKSTLFKQAILLYGGGINNPQDYTSFMRDNIINDIKTLVHQSDYLADSLGDDSLLISSSRHAQEAKAFVLALPKYNAQHDATLEAKWQTYARNIAILWQDLGIQATFRLAAAHFQICDSAAYFFNKVSDVLDPSYIPNTEDILRNRVRTTGIVETNFRIGSTDFVLLDVGGQRSERRKWMHCFEQKITLVIFVAAINEYDMFLFEDERVNRVRESLSLFKDQLDNRFLQNTDMILFLNKDDLFRKKIAKVDLKCCFPTYNGGCNYENAVNFIRKQYLSLNHNKSKDIFVHVTCATDRQNCDHVFRAVKEIVIKQSLMEGGLYGSAEMF